MPQTTPDVYETARLLREKLAKRRGVSVPEADRPPIIEEDFALAVSERADRILVGAEVPTRASMDAEAVSVGQLSQFITEMENEVERIDGKVANLLDAYSVTPEIIRAGYDVMSSVRSEDFVHEAVVQEIERGNVLEIGFEGMKFRILKVAATGTRIVKKAADSKVPIVFERSICLVEIETANGKKGRKELVVTFPVVIGEALICHDPVLQELMMKRTIVSVKVNRKTMKDRFLLLFS